MSAQRALIGYLAAVLLFLRVDLLFIAAYHLPGEDVPVSPASAWIRVQEMKRSTWFMELVWTSGTYAA